jgi:hypothetical protein
MRFALIATSAAAVVAIPLALQAAQPTLSGDQFLSEVRCAAFEEVLGDLAPEARVRLNAEARRQPAETAQRARYEAATIALQAVNTRSADGVADLTRERAAACSGAQLAVGANGAGAV